MRNSPPLCEEDYADEERFGPYVEYLRARGDQVPQVFYTHIYSRDAEQAMLTVARAQDVNAERMRDLRWKAHLVETARWRIQHRYVEPDAPVVDEGRKALRELAADEAWWVRLYCRPAQRIGGN